MVQALADIKEETLPRRNRFKLTRKVEKPKIVDVAGVALCKKAEVRNRASKKDTFRQFPLLAQCLW